MRDFEKNVLYLSEWHTPATDYADEQIGDYRLKLGRYTRGMYRMWGVDGFLMFKAMKAIPIMELQQRTGKRWRDWMIDDPPNYRAMCYYAQAARGKVLCAGLGLGLIVHELAKNPYVKEVVVVERSQEVIDLVWKYKPLGFWDTVRVEKADFYDFVENDCECDWDMIIVDIWVTSGKEEKEKAYLHAALPFGARLRLLYPKTKLVFHGFQTISDVKPVSEEMVKLITDIGGI